MNHSKFFVFVMVLAAILWITPWKNATAETTTYTYDAAGRLTRADFDNGRYIIWQYDAAGNLLTQEIGPVIPGDVHPDFQITLKDVIKALQVLVQSAESPIFREADVDGNRQIGSEEVVYILQTIAKLR